MLDGFKAIQESTLKFTQAADAGEFAESKAIFMFSEIENTAYLFSSKTL